MPSMALSSDDESEDDDEDVEVDGDEVILNYFLSLKSLQFVHNLFTNLLTNCAQIYKRFLLFCSNRKFYEHPRSRRRPLR